jgi:DNA invertase Pin-like site-specific DNA recombinase
VLTDGILDQLAKFERTKTAERTRRGRMRKAQEGKIVGTGKAPYGFYYADDYHLDQDRMIWVRRIFEMIADGHSICEVAQYLRRTDAPPSRRCWWEVAQDDDPELPREHPIGTTAPAPTQSTTVQRPWSCW